VAAEPEMVLAEVRIDEPRVATAAVTQATAAANAAATQAETARAAERRMLRKERLIALLLLALAAGVGWLEWDSLRTKNEVNIEGVFLVVVLGLIAPAGLVSPRLMIGMSHKPGRVARRYRILGTGYAIMAVLAALVAILWISGLPR
jgi:hypothetical protein